MLAVGVVYGHHRESENPFSFHGLEPDYAGRSLFAAAPYLFSQIRPLFMDKADQIGSIVYDDIRLMGKAHFYMPVIFFLSGPVICKDFHTAVGQSRRHIIL